MGFAIAALLCAFAFAGLVIILAYFMAAIHGLIVYGELPPN